MWSTPAKADGPSRRPLNWACPPSSSQRRCWSVSARGIPIHSSTSSWPPCAINSADTKSKGNRGGRHTGARSRGRHSPGRVAWGRIARGAGGASAGGNFRLVTAHRVAVVQAELAEYEGRNDGQRAEHAQRQMNAMDHVGRGGSGLIGNEQRGGQRCGRDAKAQGQLLNSAGNGAGAGGLLIVHVGIGQRVHAGVLGRREETECECGQRDGPAGPSN